MRGRKTLHEDNITAFLMEIEAFGYDAEYLLEIGIPLYLSSIRYKDEDFVTFNMVMHVANDIKTIKSYYGPSIECFQHMSLGEWQKLFARIDDALAEDRFYTEKVDFRKCDKEQMNIGKDTFEDLLAEVTIRLAHDKDSGIYQSIMLEGFHIANGLLLSQGKYDTAVGIVNMLEQQIAMSTEDITDEESVTNVRVPE